MWEHVSHGARKKKIEPKRLTSGVKDHGKDRVEWRARVRGASRDSPGGCVEMEPHALLSFRPYMLALPSWVVKFSRNHFAIIHAIHHTNHNRNFWRRKKKTNNFPSDLSFSHRFKQLLAAATAAADDVDDDEDDLWCVASSASRNLDL